MQIKKKRKSCNLCGSFWTKTAPESLFWESKEVVWLRKKCAKKTGRESSAFFEADMMGVGALFFWLLRGVGFTIISLNGSWHQPITPASKTLEVVAVPEALVQRKKIPDVFRDM
jgi:hypothetical protein